MITMMAAAATPTPIPAFAPVERPDDEDVVPVEEDVVPVDEDVDVDVGFAAEEVNSTLAELFTPASTLSVDCHLSSMGYAWMMGLLMVIAVVVVGVAPRTVKLMTVVLVLIFVQGSGVHQGALSTVAKVYPLIEANG